MLSLKIVSASDRDIESCLFHLNYSSVVSIYAINHDMMVRKHQLTIYKKELLLIIEMTYQTYAEEEK
jgi:hypothetical protein